MRSPAWMTSPTETLTSVMVPATSASTGISIFMDSSSTRVSPAPIWSPFCTTTSSTLATISARTSSAIFTPLTSLWLAAVPPTGLYRTTTGKDASNTTREKQSVRHEILGLKYSSDPEVHHGQARPQEARPQALEGQPRPSSQRLTRCRSPHGAARNKPPELSQESPGGCFVLCTGRSAPNDGGPADLDLQPCPQALGCPLTTALAGDQVLHPLLHSVDAQAGRAIFEVLLELVTALGGA